MAPSEAAPPSACSSAAEPHPMRKSESPPVSGWARRAFFWVFRDVEGRVWPRLGLAAIAAGTAILYLWALDRVGYGNSYYAAAAESGSQSWRAWFFGALDPASFISVDKPPASLWLTGLSVRSFGLSSWSILLPQALAGVGTVVLLYHTVRRSFGSGAGLIAATAMAVTPVAVVMFRYNNPDALLTFLLVAAAALGIRAVETGKARWILGAFSVIGLAFLTKTTQALLMVPALGLTYLVAAPVRLRKRLLHLAAASLIMVAAAGWWLAAVELTPASSRPYVGGTHGNSALEYALFGYNGFDRVLGETSGLQGGGFGGEAGWTRLFNSDVGPQIGWLIPAAAIGLGAGLSGRRRSRTDGQQAAWLLWGTAFLTQVIVFSMMSGVFHPYYTLTLAPVVAALSGAGTVSLWRHYRAGRWSALLLPSLILVSAWWARTLLARTPDFMPGLGTGVMVGGAVAAAALILLLVRRVGGLPPLVVAAAGLVLLLAGPAAYAVDTLGHSTAGGDPRAGPVVAEASLADRLAPSPLAVGGAGPEPLPRPGSVSPSAVGGGPESGLVDTALMAYLQANAGKSTWLAAVEGSQLAAPMILATGEPVMAMGGFNGGDPAPTVEQLAAHVAAGEVRFVLLGNDTGSRPGPGTTSSDDLPRRPPPGGDLPPAGRPSGGGVGPGNQLSAARTEWIVGNCRVVSPSLYGAADQSGLTLYDCAG
jgi:4-amino-4-deoxy-L-arabinose transferase-like glycosyltransferase